MSVVDAVITAYLAALASAPAVPGATAPVAGIKCANCGTVDDARGGWSTTFTVCDACWDILYPKAPPAGEPTPAPSREAVEAAIDELEYQLLRKGGTPDKARAALLALIPTAPTGGSDAP